jgi:hypothetical protein
MTMYRYGYGMGSLMEIVKNLLQMQMQTKTKTETKKGYLKHKACRNI